MIRGMLPDLTCNDQRISATYDQQYATSVLPTYRYTVPGPGVLVVL